MPTYLWLISDKYVVVLKCLLLKYNIKQGACISHTANTINKPIYSNQTAIEAPVYSKN